MDLDELRRIREQERTTDSLQTLRDEFYHSVAEYLETIRDRRDEAAAAANEPFNDADVRRLSDELTTAERTLEALYERRVGKIVKLASFAAADMSAEQDGLTDEEQALFDRIVEAIETHRSAVFDAATAGEAVETRTGGASEDVSEPTKSDDPMIRGDDGSTTAVDPPNSGTDDPDTEEPNKTERGTPPAIDRTTVRITADVGEIVGVDDRPYDLSINDVVTLPTKNAEPLIAREAAEPLGRDAKDP